jgi:hypothetical protein
MDLQNFCTNLADVDISEERNETRYTHTCVVKTLGTGDADLRHLRFCVINVKD